MKIRLAKLFEAIEIANIYINSFKEALPSIQLAHNNEEIILWFRDQLIPKNGTWVAEDNGKIVGFMSLDENILEELYLLPKSQGSGIGSKLINKAKELNPAGLSTYAFQINTFARSFYEKHGFVAVSFNDGERNEENEPDVLYKWKGES